MNKKWPDRNGYNATWCPLQKAHWYAEAKPGSRDVQTIDFETRYIPTLGGKPVTGVNGECLLSTRSDAVAVAKGFKSHMASRLISAPEPIKLSELELKVIHLAVKAGIDACGGPEDAFDEVVWFLVEERAVPRRDAARALLNQLIAYDRENSKQFSKADLDNLSSFAQNVMDEPVD